VNRTTEMCGFSRPKEELPMISTGLISETRPRWDENGNGHRQLDHQRPQDSRYSHRPCDDVVFRQLERAAASFLCISGVFLHFVSDAQKFFVLQLRKRTH
jgi:hypothetical protein